MRKIMIRNTAFMLLATAVFASGLMLYLRSASPVVNGETEIAPVEGDSYTASAEGFCSDVAVTATFADGALVALEIDASGETAEIGGTAATTLTDSILAAGGVDGVDAIASATLTSDAVFAAYTDCMVQAGLVEEVEEVIEIVAIEDLTVTPGADVYTASAPGYASDVSVTLAYADGVIVSATVNASGETAEIGGTAANDIAASIAIAGSAYNVDAVAGATMTSNAVLAAARYVETQVLISESTLYLASAAGYSSDVTVIAGYQDGTLVYLSVDSSGETAKVGGVTAELIAAEILAAGNADSVAIDAYAGSTITADAVLDAFAECESMVGGESNLVTVTGTAAGYSSDVVVTATYANGVLSAITVDASGETPKVGGVTAEEVIAEIAAAGNADSVDIDLYAGSTITADAVLDAFAACQDQVG